jgi:hypothetical protein
VILAEPERELTRAAEEAHAPGAFGVPTFFCVGRMTGRKPVYAIRMPIVSGDCQALRFAIQRLRGDSPKANEVRTETCAPHSTIEECAATVSDAWRIASIRPP